jgi:glucan phosphoethanolaminetransferase (alkaline phosphatase superfamily)
MPAGHSYGRINIGYAASFLQTNTSEAIEFIKLNVIGIVLCCLAMLFLFIFVIASWGLNSSSKNPVFISYCVCFIKYKFVSKTICHCSVHALLRGKGRS